MSSEGTSFEGNTSGAEPIVKTGSSADITSFDELEAVVEAPKPSRKAIDNGGSASQGKSKAKPKKETRDAEEKERNDDNAEDSNEVQEEDNKSSRQKDASEESKSEKQDKLQSKDGKSSVKQKSYKVKNGDQEIDLRSDTVLEVTVDGQKVPVQLQEVLNEFSGKTNWGKKYQELDTERKSFETSKQELQSGIDRFVKLSGEDPVSALEYACEIAGQDPRKIVQSLREQFKKAFEEYTSLTPEQRREREIQEERDYYKSRVDRAEADRVAQRTQSELDNRVKATMQKNNLDQASFVARYEELKQLQAQGVFQGELTPELVGEYHIEMEQRRQVGEIIQEVSPDLENKDSAFKDLKSIWERDPSLTPEQIKKIAVEVYGSEAARRLAKKVKKSTQAIESVSRPQASRNEPLFFDELDF